MKIVEGNVEIRNTRPEDFEAIQQLTLKVYPSSPPWKIEQLQSHLNVFPEGQLVAIDTQSGALIGTAASLIIYWDDYDMDTPWRDFTDNGYFTNHDPAKGRTLYGAEVMVDPGQRGKGVGKLLYQGRRQIVEAFGLLRIRAGARMRGYGTFAKDLRPEEYLRRVTEFTLFDPTLSFQLKQGFKVLAIVANYLRNDPESLGYAAVIEWLNLAQATEADVAKQKLMCRQALGGI